MASTSDIFPLLRRIGQFGWQEWADIARAVFELGLARFRLPKMSPMRFRALNANQTIMTVSPLTTARTGRVSRAISRAARVVPWRSDCLVQAEAARRWLASHGLQSEIRIGVRKSPENKLDAHAWLLCEGVIVTGGDISPYVPFA